MTGPIIQSFKFREGSKNVCFLVHGKFRSKTDAENAGMLKMHSVASILKVGKVDFTMHHNMLQGTIYALTE